MSLCYASPTIFTTTATPITAIDSQTNAGEVRHRADHSGDMRGALASRR